MKLKSSKVFMLVFCCVVFILMVWATITAVFFHGFEPRPRIDSGEFPFKVVYEIKGDKITIEDSIIVKYKGTDHNMDRLSPYKWVSHFESGREKSKHLNDLIGENGLVLFEDILEDGKACVVVMNLGINPYYMGYLSDGYIPGNVFIATYDLENKDGVDYHFSTFDEADLYDIYGFKIIETEFSNPINQNAVGN